MMMKKVAAAALLALGVGTASTAATITNVDGSFDFGGFDWASNASAWIQGYDIVSGGAGRTGETDTFTLRYQAYAVNVQDGNGANLVLPTLKTTDVAGGYEYTINAVLTETVTCLNGDCTLVRIDVSSGTFNIFYDTTGDALLATAGANSGMLDGDNIISGNILIGQPIITVQGATNPGNVTLVSRVEGDVTSTNSTYIVPNLASHETVTTLQFGTNTTGWTRPSNWDGIGATGADTNVNFLGQADGNSAFQAKVPEPSSLLLAGLSLIAAGAIRRRKS